MNILSQSIDMDFILAFGFLYLFFGGIPLAFYLYKKKFKIIIFPAIVLALCLIFLINTYFSLFAIFVYVLTAFVLISYTFKEDWEKSKEHNKEKLSSTLGNNIKVLSLEILSDSKKELESGVATLSYNDEGVAYVDAFFNKNYETPYEIIETIITSKLDTEKKKKWLGRAIVGNMILPGAGAIVGAMTAKEKEIIKGEKSTAMIVLKNKDDQSIRRIVVKVTPKNEFLIDNLPTAEQQDIPTPLVTAEKSNIDQLKEYKELLDLDIISQKEFENKKKDLLS